MTAGPSNVEVCGDFDEGKFCSVVGTKPTGEVMGQRGVEWQSNVQITSKRPLPPFALLDSPAVSTFHCFSK